MTNDLPLESLINFNHTFTESNLKYKLIPSLIRNRLITRVRVGFNRVYGSNTEQRGKAVQDAVRLTQRGLNYVTGTLGTTTEMDKIRNHYRKQKSRNEYLAEERVKRSVLTDLLFNPTPEIIAILKKMKRELKRNTYESLVLDAQDRYSSKYYRGIEIKRVNGCLNRIDSGEDVSEEKGNLMSGSKIFGALKVADSYLPIYHAGHYNAGVSPKNEELVINKLTTETGTHVQESIYVYQSLEKVTQLIQNRVNVVRLEKPTIYDVVGYREIYAIPYDKKSTALLALTEEKTNGSVRDRVKRHQDFEYIFNPIYKKFAREKTYNLFDSVGSGYSYYIGYVIELRRISEVIEWYINNPDTEPLCVICSEEQKEVYTSLFRYLHDRGKLYFSSKPLKSLLEEVAEN